MRVLKECDAFTVMMLLILVFVAIITYGKESPPLSGFQPDCRKESKARTARAQTEYNYDTSTYYVNGRPTETFSRV